MNKFKQNPFKYFWVTTLLTLLSPLSYSPLLALEVKQATKIPSSFEDYRKECLQRVRNQGISQDVALDICNCTLKKFQSQYTFPQFRALVEKSKSDRAAAQRLSAVGEACFDQVLYE